MVWLKKHLLTKLKSLVYICFKFSLGLVWIKWRLYFFFRRLSYSFRFWLIELRILYILRVVILLVLLYLPPMDEIDVVWWLFNNFVDVLGLVEAILDFIWFCLMGLCVFFVGFTDLPFLFYPWVVYLWHLFSGAFSWSFMEKRWAFSRILEKGRSLKRKYRRLSYWKKESARKLMAEYRTVYNKYKWRRERLYFFRKWRDLVLGYRPDWYDVVLRWLQNCYNLHFIFFVFSIWFSLFVGYLYVVLILMGKLIVIYVYPFISDLFSYIFFTLICIDLFSIYKVFIFKGYYLLSIIVSVLSVGFVDLYRCGFTIVLNEIYSVFFVLYSLFSFDILIEDFREFLGIFLFSSNYFIFFFQGLSLFLRDILWVIGCLLSWCLWILGYIDKFLLNFYLYRMFQSGLLYLLYLMLGILIVICEEFIYIGLVFYHVVSMSLFHCLDYIIIGSHDTALTVCADFYVVVLLCWILDFEYRWFGRAIVKPTPRVYEDLLKRSIFYPKMIQIGPWKTRMLVNYYVAELAKKGVGDIRIKQSKIFRHVVDDRGELLRWAWRESKHGIFEFLTYVYTQRGLLKVLREDLKEFERIQDFDKFMREFKRVHTFYGYAYLENEELDFNADVEDLMDWYVEWYAYERGTYTDDECLRYLENYNPVIPPLELLAVTFNSSVMDWVGDEEFEFYYGSHYYPSLNHIVSEDRYGLLRLYSVEHDNSLNVPFYHNETIFFLWGIPLLLVLLFFFGWDGVIFKRHSWQERFSWTSRLIKFVHFLFASFWFDWFFFSYFWDLFPLIKRILGGVRVLGYASSWLVWGLREIYSMRYARASQMMQLITLRHEYPWLNRFGWYNSAFRWEHLQGIQTTSGYVHRKVFYSRADWYAPMMKPRRLFLARRKFRRPWLSRYEWAEVADIDAFVHFHSIYKLKYNFRRYRFYYRLWRDKVFPYQFLRNSFKKMCRYRAEDYKWLNAWKRFVKAIGVKREELNFPYEFVRVGRNKVLGRQLSKFKRLRELSGSLEYNQVGLVKHMIFTDYCHDLEWYSDWRWYFYLFDSKLFYADYPIPSLRDIRFYSGAHYSMYNSWRFLYSYVDFPRNVYNYMRLKRKYFISFFSNWWLIWTDGTFIDELYDDYYLNNSLYNLWWTFYYRPGQLYGEKGKGKVQWLADVTLGHLSAFMYDQRGTSIGKWRKAKYSHYIPGFFLRSGHYLFVKHYTRELLIKYCMDIFLRRARYRRLTTQSLAFLFPKFKELDWEEWFYETIVNKYGYKDDRTVMRYGLATRKIVRCRPLWSLRPWEEVYIAHVKPWSGVKSKMSFYSIVSRFPINRYKKLDYGYYHRIGLMDSRNRWARRFLVPYFLD